jgi:5-hydroxyisourate hydrolase
MSPITTHVLDTSRGRPAEGIEVVLEFHDPDTGWSELGHGTTGSDGRLTDLLPDGAPFQAGIYRLRFATEEYYHTLGTRAFYPAVEVVVEIDDPGDHYHLPLLLSPYGYSTYRGS